MKRVPDPAASRAVLIGTSHYTGSLPDLPAVASNLEALAEVLCSADILGLPEQNCVVVADPETPAQMIDPIVEAAVEATDTLLVYYAGHGLLARQPTELHLALRGSDQQRASYTAVPYGVIGEEMARTRAERHIVVLDCCYSGRALGRWMGSGDPATALADEAAIEGTYVIAAAGETKTALAVPGERHTAFTAELLATLQHGIPGDRVHAIAFSPDGSLFATGGRDRSARVWTTATGENILTVVHHWDPDLPHAHSAYRDPRRPLPDKPVYATYGDLKGGLVYEFTPDTAPSNDGLVAAVAFSPDGRLLATGSEDNTARLWDLRTGAQLHQVLHRGAPNGVISVAFSPDGRLFATASHDETIQLWRLKADHST